MPAQTSDPRATAPARPAPGARTERLKDALKANLARRKAQARERTAQAEGGASDDD